MKMYGSIKDKSSIVLGTVISTIADGDWDDKGTLYLTNTNKIKKEACRLLW